MIDTTFKGLKILIPVSEEEKMEGIRDGLKGHDGMLFLFPGDMTMEHTSIPLTLYYFDKSGKMRKSVEAPPMSGDVPTPDWCRAILEVPSLSKEASAKDLMIKAILKLRGMQYHRTFKTRDWDRLLGMAQIDSKRVLKALTAKSPLQSSILPGESQSPGRGLSELLRRFHG